MTQLSGRLVTPKGVFGGSVEFGRRVERLELTPPGTDTGPYIFPGFIDTHVHGGAGGDTMDGARGVRTLGRFHLERGTTTLYPTTITQSWEAVMGALRGVKEVMLENRSDLPDIPGAHLEGPFISAQRLGAQPAYTQLPSPEKVTELLELGTAKLVTLAPELPGALEAARRFAAAGIRVSIGHTGASFEEVNALLQVVREAGGTVGFTHLYNAMGGLAGREPGVVGAALADEASFAELIFDGHHVHTGSFLAALQAKPDGLHLITDAIRACGLGEGETELGGQSVTVTAGAARLANGTLAGSILTLDGALRNAAELGVSLPQLSRLLSETPARYMGLRDRGRLEPGRRADLVVLNEALEVQEVYVLGKKVVG